MSSSTNYYLVAALASFGACAINIPTPVVDLGYGLWQGTLNITGQYYNFSNIRYAQAPIGELRWRPPQAPLVNRSDVNDGQDGRICPQASPIWATERALFERQYLQNPNDISAFTNVPPPGINNSAIAPTARDPRTNEDCLFLQVLVPQSIWENTTRLSKAPVMIWSFGGGFYEGNLQSQGNPAGLLNRSTTDPDTAPGMIYVSFNYRLGALGWLAGPTFNASGGVANAGLYDQRFAFEWVQEHISEFGGDPARVTVAGESAGASMSLHQVIAFGNSTPAPFQQLFTSSPSFAPSANSTSHEAVFQQYLANAQVKNLAELRNASSETLIRANEVSVFHSPYGQTGFGPVIGDVFVPSPPDVLLSQGRYAKNVKAYMASHNTDEGLIFTNPAIQNTSAFNSFLQGSLLPSMSPMDFNYVTNTLYPAIFTNQSGLGYNNTISRLATLIADLLVTCNANALLNTISPSNSHAYLFSEGAGLHGEDTAYIFYNLPGPVTDVYGIGNVNQTSAEAMQAWIINFVFTGNPNGQNGNSTNIAIPNYSPQRSMALVSSSQLGKIVSDPAQEQRCQYWQSGKYFGELFQ